MGSSSLILWAYCMRHPTTNTAPVASRGRWMHASCARCCPLHIWDGWQAGVWPQGQVRSIYVSKGEIEREREGGGGER
eukprot:1154292-Pelagomonas_calceolata.AAC.3